VTAQPLRRSPKRWGTLAEAVYHSTRSRSRIYQLAGQNRTLLRKDGRRTLVDLFLLDELNEQLPVADIKL
jgi:hypothetical protein